MNNKVHFIGIGGEGMSGLAKVMWEQGFRISGSNIVKSKRTGELERRGIRVDIGHREANLRGADSVVFSSAIADDNIELAAARRRGLEVMPRLEMLARIMAGRYSIGVAGTHGKTTTTAMIATLLEKSGMEPTFLIGAPCQTLGGNGRLGKGRYLIAEVDESDGHFTKLCLQLAVVTNIGEDHLDNYGSEKAIYESFAQFIRRGEGAILCADDRNIREILKNLEGGLTFGIERESDLMAQNIKQDGLNTQFDLIFRGKGKGRIKIRAPGHHNVYNALAAILTGWKLELDFEKMISILREFTLPERRFQILKDGVCMVVDDYAHLPEEIEANLKAIRSGWSPQRVIALFQPHRFTRIKYINGRFGRSFDLADLVIITDIYPAFERPIPGVDASLIVEALDRRGRSGIYYLPEKGEIFTFLGEVVRPGDFIISFGAGDIWRVTHKLASAYETLEPKNLK